MMFPIVSLKHKDIFSTGSYRHSTCYSPLWSKKSPVQRYYDMQYAEEHPQKAKSLSEFELGMLQNHNSVRER